MTDVRHPLLRPFPLTLMSLATFAVVFALLMARMQTHLPQGDRRGTPASQTGTGGEAVVTRASGSQTPAQAGGSAGPATSAEEAAASTGGASVVTRASGAAVPSGGESE